MVRLGHGRKLRGWGKGLSAYAIYTANVWYGAIFHDGIFVQIFILVVFVFVFRIRVIFAKV
jgi:hypothetical protein